MGFSTFIHLMKNDKNARHRQLVTANAACFCYSGILICTKRSFSLKGIVKGIRSLLYIKKPQEHKFLRIVIWRRSRDLNTKGDALKYPECLILHAYLQKVYQNDPNCMETIVVQLWYKYE